MPSPMDECNNLVNIDSSDTSILKRKLDGSSEELSFPCKKIAISPANKSNGSDGSMIPATPSVPQIKLTKAEREVLRMEKAKERELERQRREQERQKREEEREQEKQKREEERQKREEERQKREEGKQKREDERLKKQAERDELKRKKDAEREEARKEKEKREREKEEQRRKKEEEIEKKNKTQLRLNNFFSLPKKKSESPSQPITSIPDYQRYFQPFHVRQGVVVAPSNQFIRDPTALGVAAASIDRVLSHPDSNLPLNVNDRLDTLIPVCKSHRAYPRGRSHLHTAKEIISLLNDHPTTIDPYSSLKQLPRKHLQYAEDVRPAYNGTFSRRTKLTPRNPFKRDPESFAYDYDSEAEWEFEPEDGENLDDESIDDDEELGSMMGDSGDEEDRAFLDDDDDEAVDNTVKNKGKQVGKRLVTPLVPMIKGVCWEIRGVQDDEVLAGMRASILLYDDRGDGIDAPINPFSTEYWVREMPPPPAPKIDSQMVLKKAEGSGTVELVKPASLKTKNPFPDALLADFLKAIQGTTYNQTLLVELLKKQFPTATKGGIIEKLKEVAFRTGRRDVDHWEIRKEFLSVMGM